MTANPFKKYLAMSLKGITAAKRYSWLFIKVAVLSAFGLLILERLIRFTPLLSWLKLIDLSVYLSFFFGAISIAFKYIKDRVSAAAKAIEANSSLRQGQAQALITLENRLRALEDAYKATVEDLRSLDNRISSVKVSMNAFEGLIENDQIHNRQLEELRRDFEDLQSEQLRLKERQMIGDRLALFASEIAKCLEQQAEFRVRLEGFKSPHAD